MQPTHHSLTTPRNTEQTQPLVTPGTGLGTGNTGQDSGERVNNTGTAIPGARDADSAQSVEQQSLAGGAGADADADADADAAAAEEENDQWHFDNDDDDEAPKTATPAASPSTATTITTAGTKRTASDKSPTKPTPRSPSSKSPNTKSQRTESDNDVANAAARTNVARQLLPLEVDSTESAPNSLPRKENNTAVAAAAAVAANTSATAAVEATGRVAPSPTKTTAPTATPTPTATPGKEVAHDSSPPPTNPAASRDPYKTPSPTKHSAAPFQTPSPTKEQLQAELREMAEKNKSLQTKAEQLASHVRQLQSENATLASENDALSAKNTQLVIQLAKLRQDLDSALSQVRAVCDWYTENADVLARNLQRPWPVDRDDQGQRRLDARDLLNTLLVRNLDLSQQVRETHEAYLEAVGRGEAATEENRQLLHSVTPIVQAMHSFKTVMEHTVYHFDELIHSTFIDPDWHSPQDRHQSISIINSLSDLLDAARIAARILGYDVPEFFGKMERFREGLMSVFSDREEYRELFELEKVRSKEYFAKFLQQQTEQLETKYDLTQTIAKHAAYVAEHESILQDQYAFAQALQDEILELRQVNEQLEQYRRLEHELVRAHAELRRQEQALMQQRQQQVEQHELIEEQEKVIVEQEGQFRRLQHQNDEQTATIGQQSEQLQRQQLVIDEQNTNIGRQQHVID